MGVIKMLAGFLGAAAFFAVGALWYGVLFKKPWERASGLSPEQISGGNMALIFGLCFAFELLIALMLGHQFARTSPSARGIVMISTGFGATIMAPAVGIHYLFLRKPGRLFAIDAGHMIVGMAAMGAVFVAFMPD